MLQFQQILKGFIIASALSAAPGWTATLNTNSSGQLTGASGVDVGGTLFDVSFQDGTCAALYDGCDEVADFLFSIMTAYVAAEALLDQVFLDGPDRMFDSNPELTNGISSITTGTAITIFHADPVISPGILGIAGAFFTENDRAEEFDQVPPVSDFSLTGETTDSTSSTFAVWSVSQTVPEIDTTACTGSVASIVALLLFLRSRRRSQDFPVRNGSADVSILA